MKKAMLRPVIRTEVDKDMKAMVEEIKRLELKLNANRSAPKYDRRSDSYEPWFYAQGRLHRQIAAAHKAIEVFGVRRYDD
jgi:hypothetical protein